MGKSRKNSLKEWALVTLGVVIMVIGIYFFKFPNNFSTGGVTGAAIILKHYIPSITQGTYVTIINVGLLILGFLILGPTFGVRTVYASLLMSLLLDLLEIICPLSRPLTSQPLMELMFAVGLPAWAPPFFSTWTPPAAARTSLP